MGMDMVLASVKPSQESISGYIERHFLSHSNPAGQDQGTSDDVFFEPLELHRSWHGLHWLLTGTERDDEDLLPLGFLLAGGVEHGDEGISARSFDREWSVRIAQSVVESRWEDVRRRFDPMRMDAAEVYPSNGHRWWQDEPSEHLHWLEQEMTRVQMFMSDQILTTDRDLIVVLLH